MPNAASSASRAGTLNELTATEMARLIAQGKASCEEVARAHLARIAERDAQVKAWQYLDADYVIAQARARDQQSASGALHGVPFGIKDIFDTFDMPTEYGSPIYAGNRTRNDAACVALGRAAGGVLMGKTVTTEFANRYPGKTTNPFDAKRTPGGSSSGSAAAVADHQVALAIGSQTTASTLRPASFCGVYGFRPTCGELSCSGMRQSSGMVDTVGLFARSLEDIALYRDVLLGQTPRPLAAIDAPPRIGFCRTPMWSRLESSTAQLLEQAAKRLAQAGARVIEVELAAEFSGIEEAHRAITSFEFVRNLAHEIKHHEDQISTMLRSGRIADGKATTYERYREAREFAASCRALLNGVFGDVDVLLAPVATGEAPVGLNATGDATLCVIWTTMQVPALSLPVFTGPNGLPVGAQLIAPMYGDRKLIEAAQWVAGNIG